MRPDILTLLRRTLDEWRSDGAPQIAAALTYYTLLSVAPLLVVLVNVLGSYLGRATVTDQVLEQAYTLAGPLGEQLAAELIAAAGATTLSTAASVIAALIAVFGAMRVFRQLRVAFDRMWDIPPDEPPAGGLAEQIRFSLSALGKHNLAAFLMVVAVGLMLLVSIMLSSVITIGADYLAPYVRLGTQTLRVAESLGSLALITTLFAVVYRFLPRTSIAWRDVWLGAAITAALFIAG